MSDPDHTRPALPDPQRDRHVSFPDDAPSADPSPPGLSLPLEAWAPRSSATAAPSPAPSSWQAPVPPVLTTPPVRRPQRRRPPGWVAFFLIPPLLLGLSSHNDAAGSYECWTYDSGAGPGVQDCDSTMDGTLDGTSDGGADAPGSVVGVWVERVTGSTAFAEVLTGTPQVRPVPADASVLRVEVVPTTGVAGDALEAQVDTTVSGFTLDSWNGPLPVAFEIHVDEHPSNLSVSVVVGTGSVQCRVYADDVLVAVDTSDSAATCSPAL